MQPVNEYYPCVVAPCVHARECSGCYFRDKKCHMPLSNTHAKDYHPEECGHTKDVKLDNNRRMRKGRVKPHRHGGVIPKYTGHVPGK